MICPYCGASVQPDARFCGDCGKPLAVPLTVAMPTPAVAPARPAGGTAAQPPSPSISRPAVAAAGDSLATTQRRVANSVGGPTRPMTSPHSIVKPATAPGGSVAAPAASAAAAAAPGSATPAEAAPVRASQFLDAVESPVARVLRIVLLLVLDAGLIGVGTYYLYQFIRLSPAAAAAAPSIDIGQPSLVRGQEAGREPPAPVAPGALPPGTEVAGAPGAPARATGAAVAKAPRGKAAVAPATPATPAAPVFGGARPAGVGRPGAAAPAPAPAPAPQKAPGGGAAPAPAPTPAPAPAARDDDPGEVEAQIDAESVRIIMRQHKGDVRTCYNQGLKLNPDASGTLEVRFAINAQGRAVRRRVVSDTLGIPAVSECILGQLGRWQFPRPVGGEVEFEYPFLFSPGR